MPRPALLVSLVCLLALALTACGGAEEAADQEAPPSPPPSEVTGDEPSPVPLGGTATVPDGSELTARLDGAAEVPGPGAPDASGTAQVTVDADAAQLCYTIAVEGLEDVQAAHVHAGGADVAGDVVVPLEAPEGGTVDACADADQDLLTEISEAPEEFYVNVHTAELPDGAVRGQLTAR